MSLEPPAPSGRLPKRKKQAGEAKRTKRGAGEGFVRRRPSGRWFGQLMVGWRMVPDPVTGLPVARKDIRSVTRNTRQEVVAALAEYRRQYEAGVLPEANRLTLADLLERWLSTFVVSRRSEGTRRAYTTTVRTHLVPRLGTATLTQLSPLRLTQAINELAGTGLSENTVARIYTTLSSALTWAVRMRLLDRHPLQGLERPRKGESVGRVLTSSELRDLLSAARIYQTPGGALVGRWWPLFALMASTGLTTGESLGLTWGDISPEGVLRVGRAARHRPRQVPLSPLGLEAVRQARLQQQQYRLSIGVDDWPWAPDPETVWPLFTSHNGRRVDPRRAQEAFAAILRRSGVVGHVRPHDLRHTFNTVAMAGGYDAKVRALHLGHTTAINQSTYTHPDLEQQAAMAREVERRLLEDAG